MSIESCGRRPARLARLLAATFLGITSTAYAQTPRPASVPPALKIDPAVQRVVMQMQAETPRGGSADPEPLGTQVQLTPPGPERIFGRLDSEREFQERVRQEALERTPPERIAFPPEPILTTQRFVRRVFPPISEVIEPQYVTFSRLHFEQKNFERYGWDLGYITPFVCAGKFFWDCALFPYHVGTDPFRKFDTGAGQCLPGSPVPLVMYPPEISVTGAVLEATVIVGLFGIFPGP